MEDNQFVTQKSLIVQLKMDNKMLRDLIQRYALVDQPLAGLTESELSAMFIMFVTDARAYLTIMDEKDKGREP